MKLKLFAVISGIAIMAGCASPTNSEESEVISSEEEVTESREDALDESTTSIGETALDDAATAAVERDCVPPLRNGDYNAALLKTTNPATGQTTVFNPPSPDPFIIRRVFSANEQGFKIRLMYSEEFGGGSAGNMDIRCTFAANHKSFTCTDWVNKPREPGGRPGIYMDGHSLPPDAPRAFDAVIFQRVKYTGKVISRNEYQSTQTLRTWCEGSQAECSGLKAYIKKAFGGLAVDGLTTVVQNKRSSSTN